MSWATRRQAMFGLMALLPFILISGVILYAFLNTSSCFDGKQNGDELGVDCDGSCEKVCPSRVAEPAILWARTFQVTGDMYNAVAMIENPNVGLTADQVPYSFVLYDRDNLPIVEQKGQLYIPPGKVFAVFRGGIRVDREPVRTTFEFSDEPTWRDVVSIDPGLRVRSQSLVNQDTSPHLSAYIQNPSSYNISNLEVVAILYDERRNAVHTSRTVVDALPRDSESPVVFTWPEPFKIEPGICQMPADVMLLTDRSGSMNDDGLEPPQPLTDALEAAHSFLEKLGNDDRVGLVSFATTATSDESLTFNHSLVREAISGIEVLPSEETGYTNLGDAIKTAFEELSSAGSETEQLSTGNRQKIMVVLTDGDTNYPTENPEEYALEAVNLAKDNNIEIYVIGLGDNFNQDFMREVASGEEFFYNAVSSVELEDIYLNIATSICEKGPYMIEILPLFKHADISE